MTELEIIAHAQIYLEKLAKGINPLTEEEVAENDVVNNVRISRCLFYTADLLKKIVDNRGNTRWKCLIKSRFHLIWNKWRDSIIRSIVCLLPRSPSDSTR